MHNVMHRVLLRFTQRISSGEAALATATLLQLRPWLIPGEDEEGVAWRCGQQPDRRKVAVCLNPPRCWSRNNGKNPPVIFDLGGSLSQPQNRGFYKVPRCYSLFNCAQPERGEMWRLTRGIRGLPC